MSTRNEFVALKSWSGILGVCNVKTVNRIEYRSCTECVRQERDNSSMILFLIDFIFDLRIIFFFLSHEKLYKKLERYITIYIFNRYSVLPFDLKTTLVPICRVTKLDFTARSFYLTEHIIRQGFVRIFLTFNVSDRAFNRFHSYAFDLIPWFLFIFFIGFRYCYNGDWIRAIYYVRTTVHRNRRCLISHNAKLIFFSIVVLGIIYRYDILN